MFLACSIAPIEIISPKDKSIDLSAKPTKLVLKASNITET